ncbi:hypothetical protein WISP_105756 [Willisornis vidua]|uniref:Uncharacterized protein n=1 Tax=Willisornis vidua TaxID=1566151 RepID=A0ABQ9D329_9PASS|nr:hypothetical protein WISP_105756 [Willisornis vidua]
MTKKADYPQSVLGYGIVPPQGLDLAFTIVDLHESPVSPFLQPMEVPLNGSTIVWCMHHCSQFCIICKPKECVLWPIFQVINGEMKPYWPQNQLLGYTISSFQMNFMPLTITLQVLQFSQFSTTCTGPFIMEGYQVASV